MNNPDYHLGRVQLSIMAIDGLARPGHKLSMDG